MKSVRSKRLRAIGFFIVLLAMVVSIFQNGFVPKALGINSRESDKIYDELTNTNKVKLEVRVKSIDQLKNLATKQLDEQGFIKLSSEEQNRYCLYIYQINPLALASIISSLSEIGSITSKTEKTSSNSSQIDIAAKLKDREIMYQKAFEDYTNASVKTTTQKERIDDLQAEIDTLKYQIANQKNREMTVLYIKAQVIAGSTNRLMSYKNILFDFLKYLAIFTLGLAALYFGTILLIYFLALLGIRFPSFSGLLGKGYNDYAGYKGYRGYGSYGYGGSRKRRTKRIYRNKHSSGGDKTDEPSDQH